MMSGVDFDDRYDWIEVRELSGKVTWYQGACLHRDVVPVPGLDGSIVAGLCLTCDEQLPPPALR